MSERIRIKIPQPTYFEARNIRVPISTWKERVAPLQLQSFVPFNSNLKPLRPISSEVQLDHYQRFQAEPSYPALYGVGSSPADNRARYLAAHLTHTYCESYPNSRVIWEGLQDVNTERSQLRDNDPDLLVLYNVFEQTSPKRMELLRDLLERYDSIPRIVITAGIDPFSYVTGRLALRLDYVHFHSAKAAQPRAEVV